MHHIQHAPCQREKHLRIKVTTKETLHPRTPEEKKIYTICPSSSIRKKASTPNTPFESLQHIRTCVTSGIQPTLPQQQPSSPNSRYLQRTPGRREFINSHQASTSRNAFPKSNPPGHPGRLGSWPARVRLFRL